MVSYKNGLSLRFNGQEVFCVSLVGTLYHINHCQIQTVSTYVVTSGSLRLWHRRLGHLNLRVIKDMQRKNMVNGLSILLPQEYDRVCKRCALGKSHCLPFPKQSNTVYKKMDLVVIDLTGPMSVPTWLGMSYALMVVEASCHFPIGRLLKAKSEAAAAVKEIVTMFKRQSGKKLKKMRSDLGTEFIKELIDNFCKKNGVIHETTVPYTLEQNAIVERAITVAFKMVRCMLYSAGMDLGY